MLGKLMKYDLRSNFRTLLPLWLTTHGLAIVYSLLYGSRITPSSAVGRFLLIVLPAIGVLVQTLGPVWGWTWADPAATTINAVALTIGVVIGASTLKARASKA